MTQEKRAAGKIKRHTVNSFIQDTPTSVPPTSMVPWGLITTWPLMELWSLHTDSTDKVSLSIFNY